MADERWRRTWELFHDALDVAPEARAAFLDRAVEDADLRARVDRLLIAHEDAPTLLDEPDRFAGLMSSAADPLAEHGAAIDGYALLETIGSGGMGVVYRARQERPIARTVALKLIQVGMDTREVIARFEAERQALAVLEHPNIARVLDAGASADGRPFFVMELVDGVPLTQYCDQHRLSTRARIALFIPLCRAIHHAHQKGIIHRDLKPSNVIVTEMDGRPVPKVIDFGIARAIDRERSEQSFFTEHGRVVGTPEYMSPEQAEMSRDIDIRSDIYSLGVLLYEVLAGCLPFEPTALRRAAFDRMRELLDGDGPRTPSTRVGTLGASARDIADRRGTDPTSLRRELRGDLDWIVMRAMEKQRARRYGAASELAAELERHLRHEPVLAGPPSAGYRLAKFARRHRVGVAAGLVAILALVAVALHATWQNDRTRRALETARREAAKAAQVADFLQALFVDSDPNHALGETLTVREMLDRGAAEIVGTLADQPEVKASMMAVMGEVYTRLGLLDEAEPLLVESLAIRTRVLDELHAEVVDGVIKMASLELARGAIPAARYRLELLLGRLRGAVDADDTRIVEVLRRLGTVHLEAGDLDASEALLREAVDRRRELNGAEHPETVGVLTDLGLTLLRKGAYAEAEEALRTSLEIGEARLPVDHPTLATRRSNLGSVLKAMGRYDQAASLLEQALASRRRVYGDDHVLVATSLNNLAGVDEAAGRSAEAEARYREALSLWRQRLGDQHPGVATMLANLGTFYRRAGQLERAEPLLREALALQRRLLGNEHPDVATSLNNLGTALEKLGRLEEALAIQSEALAIRKRVQGESHPDLAASLSNLGVIYRKLGRLDAAREHYLEALALEERTLGRYHPNVALRLLNLGILHARRDQPADAVPAFERAVAILGPALGHDHFRVGRAQVNLGIVLARLGRLTEAEAALEDGLRIYTESLAPSDRRIPDTRLRLGEVQIALDRHAEAETHLQAALDGFVDHRGTPHDKTLQTLDALADLYDTWGRPARAEAVRRRRAEF